MFDWWQKVNGKTETENIDGLLCIARGTENDDQI